MYKYQVLKIGKSSLDVELNKMGLNGWKAVFFENTGDGKYRVIFEYNCQDMCEDNAVENILMPNIKPGE